MKNIFFIMIIFLLLIPTVSSHCISDTEISLISNISGNNTSINASMIELFEIQCEKYNMTNYYTRGEVQTLVDVTSNIVVENMKDEIMENVSKIQKQMESQAVEINQTLEDFEIKKTINEILKILNQTTELEEWKSNLVNTIDDRFSNFKRDYATIEYVQEQIENNTYTPEYNPSFIDQYGIFVFYIIIISSLLAFLYFKFLKKKNFKIQEIQDIKVKKIPGVKLRIGGVNEKGKKGRSNPNNVQA